MRFTLKLALGTLAVLVSLFGSLIALETIARLTKPAEELHGGELHVPHPVLGWVPQGGKRSHTAREFKVTYDINAWGMHGRSVDQDLDRMKLRIVALGDSNTFGRGVFQHEAWPNVMEDRLFGSDAEAGTVYNLGVTGYSLGQSLLRLRETQDTIEPHIILLGFSTQNDLYDIVPPRLGGFVFFAGLGRAYFDLDEAGNLIERRDLVGKTLASDGAAQEDKAAFFRIRAMLRQFELYKRLRNSNLAMWLMMRTDAFDLQGLDTHLKRKLDSNDRYRWRLAEKIIAAIGAEGRARGAQVSLVNIPHIAEVYDSVWAWSFGARPEKYDRWIGGQRLAEISRRVGIHFIDTTRGFVDEARRTGTWLHYRADGHPTAAGHRIIAEAVVAGLRERGIVP